MNSDHTHDEAAILPESPCALLWDESLLWGVIAWQALKEAGLPFDLLRSEDIRTGALSHYRMIFVPGGWASNKIHALGEAGMEEIRRFVAEGGSYLGICGGAGMAVEKGLDLLPVRRKSRGDRVPSFSGPVRLSLASHAMWHGIQDPVFWLWWPSQLHIEDPQIKVLARYEEADAGAFSADIGVADGGLLGWSELEQRYGILLDPARLRGEPGVVEGCYGRGRVILSLVHFDTPRDPNGAAVLRNLWGCLASCHPSDTLIEAVMDKRRSLPELPQDILESAKEIQAAAGELIAFGARNLLWCWRSTMILQWRRGVRGLEYSTLAVMVGQIVKRLNGLRGSCCDCGPTAPRGFDLSRCRKDLKEIRRQLIPFCERAKRLLFRERFYMTTAPLSPIECADAEISRLRKELFGSAMSHGGRFKRLIEQVDDLLYRLIKEE